MTNLKYKAIILLCLSFWILFFVPTSIKVTKINYDKISEIKKRYNLPVNKDKNFIQVNATVSAYNADISQCDNSPNITASGYNIKRGHHNVAANNCLSFGTIVNINNLNYIILDRMNSRYNCHTYDILMNNYKDAVNFGRKQLTIKIYENRR